MKKLLASVFGAVLVSLGLFFLAIIAYLWSSQVMPSLRNGTLNIETNIMILNRTWVGNELYLLLAAYLALAMVFGYSAVRVVRRAWAN